MQVLVRRGQLTGLTAQTLQLENWLEDLIYNIKQYSILAQEKTLEDPFYKFWRSLLQYFYLLHQQLF